MESFFQTFLLLLLLGLLYRSLYREVRARRLGDELVFFGFSPWTILPVLIYVLTRKAATCDADPDVGTDDVRFEQPCRLWLLGLGSVFTAPAPMLLNAIVYAQWRRSVPRRIDEHGLLMRSGQRLGWQQCSAASIATVSYFGAAQPDGLRLNFGPRRISLPAAASEESRALGLAYRQLRDHRVPFV
jgi:hypothetical protein